MVVQNNILPSKIQIHNEEYVSMINNNKSPDKSLMYLIFFHTQRSMWIDKMGSHRYKPINITLSINRAIDCFNSLKCSPYKVSYK